MDKPINMQEFDQASAAIADVLPPMWHRLFESCRTAGFDELQSFRLVQTHILANSGSTIIMPPSS